MKNDKTIKLYIYVDGVNDVPFYGSDAGEYEAFILANGEQYITSEGFVFNVRNVNEQIELGDFRYDAKRMGGAPTITCTLMYEDCLDDFWSENVYAKFNGEKYYLKQTPTSSYNNESTMYKHDLELVSERVILDNVYFFDAVVGNPQGDDKPVSNSTKVVFFGNVHEFVKRLNSSLEYAKLLKWEDGVDGNGNAIKIPKGYHVVVDNDANITTEEKLMSFEDQFFSNVLQEIYNTYEVPYYFEGKTIHIGYSNKNEAVPTFSYGVDDALLSITKNNANYKIVNRATATGSSDNIPFYYPNNSPKGFIEAEVSSTSNIEVGVIDYEKFSNNVGIDEILEFSSAEYSNVRFVGRSYGYVEPDTYYTMRYGGLWGASQPLHTDSIDVHFNADTVGEIPFSVNFIQESFKIEGTEQSISPTIEKKVNIRLSYLIRQTLDQSRWQEVFTYREDGGSAHTILPIEKTGLYKVTVDFCHRHIGEYVKEDVSYLTKVIYSLSDLKGWTLRGRSVELKDIGLYCNGTPSVGDTITQKLVKYVKSSQNLMPSIYRETDGEERFYNATNGTYEGVEFNNPYVEGKPKEHIFTVEDIKPTIKKTEVNGLRIDMFSDFAYDLDDNDELIENEEGSEHEYVHSYFFAKLRKLDFNLFDHAIENQPMTISFTSGDCGACNFEIGVTEEFPQKNLVQVNADGTLKRDEKGRVICGQFEDITEDECQPQQQDTINNEVWIALKKEETTYGILMPKAPKFNDAGEQTEAGHRPKACTRNPDGTVNDDGDTFVILGINLPQSYITNAEKQLEAEIIKYLQDNNDEKFTFSINFSRIYFEENKILDQLNENSKIRIIYDNKPYDLYVSSFSYSMSEGEVLPEIRVELDETLKVSQNALQNAISQVKSELGRAIGSIDVVGAATPYFIRKDADDEAQGRINFKKGIKFGEGGKVEILDNNSAKLTIEYLEVTKKASFTSLEIKEKTHVGGQIIISPAAMTCGEVEELENAYRCYFQTKNSEGNDEIFNQFAENDLAICQTYNAWGSRYYWRKVIGIGEDYIDLSKTLCDEYSDIPVAGDKIVQLGNTEDITRQAAIVLSAYGEDAPSFIMYNGINNFTLVDKNITGIIWNPNTLEPQMYSYGSFFFGDRQLDGNYITFQQKDGESKKTLSINADINIGANSTGLTNLAEWKEKQDQIDAATQGVTLVQQDVQNLQDQIDGVVENHFYEGVPTNDNFPAIQWTNEDEKANHLGDTYVNIASKEQDPDNAGKAWRWAYTDSEHTGYHWHPIADTDAVKALLEAYKAQAGIDDLQYLKGTFEKSVDVDGVVMSEMVAVKDGSNENKVVAFVNGSNFGEDTQYGKLIIAAGISDISAPSTATTKIYENGRIEVDAPNVNGKVVISDYGFTYYDTTDGTDRLKASMGGDCAGASGKFVAENAEDPTVCVKSAILAIGSSTHAAAVFQGETLCEGNMAIDENLQCNTISPFPGSLGISLKIDDIYRNDTAFIKIPIGSIYGLRPRVRLITSSSNAAERIISELDHTVIINNSSAITITLPSNPQEGQTYKILHPSTVGVTIDWNGSQAMNVSTGNTPNATFSARRSVVLTYCSRTWYAEYLELSN